MALFTRVDYTPTEEELAWVKSHWELEGKIPENFEITAPPHPGDAPPGRPSPVPEL